MAFPTVATAHVETEMQQCAGLTDSLERLVCYDRVYQSTNMAPVEPGGPSLPEQDEPAAMQEALDYLSSPKIVGDQLHLTLIDSRTGTALDDSAFDDLAKGGAALDDMRERADFVMAMAATPDSSETAVLTVACRAGITEMRVYWTNPFNSQRIQLRLRRGDGAGEMVAMRTKGDGFILEAPRGLEAIRIIRRMVEQSRIELLAGEAGVGRARSAFFEMRDLRAGLGLQARICSWSGF